MNTVWADRQGVHDSLAIAADARSWNVSDEGLVHLRALRDALRRLAAARTGDPRAKGASAVTEVDDAIRTVNHYAGLARPVLELVDGSFARTIHTTNNPDEQVLGTIAAHAVELFGQGDDLDLRACLAPGCVLYFVKDHPRREWCSTGCGNRARAARHYARHSRI
jgi:predicted RNA-binding Zn ribbon-like protein